LAHLATAACGTHTQRVIEIGPGRGALTRRLLLHCDELHAVEIDPQLAAHLQSAFADEAKLHIHLADALAIDLAQWGPAVIAGNLPYYITSPLVLKFVNLDARFSRAVFLVQEEVAQRITARHGTRDYGYLSVATQLVCDVELISKVPASAFSPPPKVNSAAIRLTRKPDVPLDLRGLLEFVGRCFAHKRKTLRNNLRPFFRAIDLLPEANLRAEQLRVPQFAELRAKLLYTEAS